MIRQKGNVRRLGALALSLLVSVSMLPVSPAAADGENQQENVTGQSNVVDDRVGMPTMGKVKPLVVKVAFPDYPFESEVMDESVYPDETLMRMINGDESTKEGGKSLHDFYEISSYGQLDIACDQIYHYTAEHDRDYYSDEANPVGAPKTGVIPDDLPVPEEKMEDDETGSADGRLVYGLDDDVTRYGTGKIKQYRNLPEDADSEDDKRQYLLIDEILEALDEEIDYQDFDSDNDGCIDAIYVNFAGPLGEWSTTWWPHVSVRKNAGTFDGVKSRSYTFIHYEGPDEYQIESATKTLIHETGHLLGIPDYYSYEKNQDNMLGSFDIMATGSQADHNGFSKWTYGWLQDEDIAFVDSRDEEVTIHLTPIDSAQKDGKMIAVIARDYAWECGIYSKYFLVEYDAGQNLNANVMNGNDFAPGFRIFAVNAELDSDTWKNYAKNNNYSYYDRLIYDVRSTRNSYGFDDTLYRDGDSFTPDSDPASRFYFDESKIGIPTGIVMTDFVTGEDPSFKVSFTDIEEPVYDVQFTGQTENLENTLNLKLYSNVPLSINDYEKYTGIYLLDEEGTHYEVNMTELMDEERAYLFTSYRPEPVIQPNTSYTLVIPDGLFKVTDTQILGEMRIPVSTGDFEKVESIGRTVWKMSDFESNWVKAGEDRVVRLNGFCRISGKVINVSLQMVDANGNESFINNIELPFVAEDWEFQDEYIYIEPRLFRLEDGTLAAGLSYLDRETFYHIDLQGNLIGTPQAVENSRYQMLTVSGNNILVADYDYLTETSQLSHFDFEHPMSTVIGEQYINLICGMNDNEYAKDEYEDGHWYFAIYDMNNVRKNRWEVESIYYCLVYRDDSFLYLSKRYGEEDGPYIYLGQMDRNGQILKEENITDSVEYLKDVWEGNLMGIEKTEEGYMVYGVNTIGYNKIRFVTFFDQDMKQIGYRCFYENEPVIPLKSGIFTTRSAYLPTEDEPLNFYYLLKYSGADTEESGQQGEGQKDDSSSGQKTDDPTGSDGTKKDDGQNHSSDASKADGTAKSEGRSKSSPKTGDQWPVLWLAMLALSGATAFFGRKKRSNE